MHLLDKLQAAVKFHQAGNHANAERLYREVLTLQPHNPDALHLLGLLEHQQGHHEEAVRLIEQAIKTHPNVSDFYNNCGEAYRALGRQREALIYYRRALKLNPGNPLAHNNLAILLHDRGAADEALMHYRKALSVEPRYLDAQFNLGKLLLERRKPDAALPHLQKALDLDPRFRPAWILLSAAHQALGRLDEALHAIREACALDSSNLGAINQEGLLLIELGDFEGAAACFHRLLARDPNVAEAHCNLGVALHQLDSLEEAAASYRQALALRADYVEAQKNYATVLRDRGAVDESIAAFEQLLQAQPDLADAHFGLAFSALLAGDFERGWAEYEWRWRSSNMPHAKPKLKGREWTGQELQGRAILVYTEQGAGDAIQFARFIPLLAALGAQVILQCPPALARLLRTVEGVTAVSTPDQQAGPYDYHCALMSLPRLLGITLGITLDRLPANVPYLQWLESPLTRELDALEFDATKLKIGIAWTGSSTHINNRKRSCPPALLAQLAELPDVALYSLQKTPPEDSRTAAGPPWQDYTPQLEDFSDTAALIDRLDLVVSVDTSVAHLTGALGKPVWLLLAFAADWRWLSERRDSPWYPTMRLYRQARPGDWPGVLASVMAALRDDCLMPRP